MKGGGGVGLLDISELKECGVPSLGSFEGTIGEDDQDRGARRARLA